MDNSDGYTNWPNNTARITQKGGVEVDSSGKYSCEDIYTFVMAWGDRPGTPGVSIVGLPAIGDKLAGFPAPGQDEPDLRPVVNKIAFSQPDPAARVWQATVSYGTPAGSDSGEGDDEVKVLTRSVGFRTWNCELQKSYLDATIDGIPVPWADKKAVVNAVGEPFANPINVENISPVIEVARLEKKAMTLKAIKLSGTINIAAETICGITIPIYCGRLYVSSKEIDDDTFDYETTYHIECSKDFDESGDYLTGWNVPVLNAGFKFYLPPVSSGGDKVGPIAAMDVQENGLTNPANMPVMLDEDGYKSTNGSVYITFYPYRASSWTSLKLPSSL